MFFYHKITWCEFAMSQIPILLQIHYRLLCLVLCYAGNWSKWFWLTVKPILYSTLLSTQHRSLTLLVVNFESLKKKRWYARNHAELVDESLGDAIRRVWRPPLKLKWGEGAHNDEDHSDAILHNYITNVLLVGLQKLMNSLQGRSSENLSRFMRTIYCMCFIQPWTHH